MNQFFEKKSGFKGELSLPGDKSISHRAVMFSAMAEGESKIYNCLMSEDVISTMNCFRQLGCDIVVDGAEITVVGKGYKGFVKPNSDLDAGNSGTTSRLISGILAAQKFDTTLIGDSSLSKRPMNRVINPLKEMGADIIPTADGTLPMTIKGTKGLLPIDYVMPVASAQVKSAVLLAGLHSEERTCVIEKEATRNHTEKMLNLEVVPFEGGRKIYSSKENYPIAGEYIVPSDISTAAFFMVLGAVSDNSEIKLKRVLLNDTRDGVVKILLKMGANVEIENLSDTTGEAFGDVIVTSGKLKNIEIGKDIIPNIIDEIPVLSVAGLMAEGEFVIRNAKELRVKESDRIAALCENYRKLGVDVDEYEDGFKLSGKITEKNVTLESFGDHRIAMAFAVLGLVTDCGVTIKDFECANISNPQFLAQIASL